MIHVTNDTLKSMSGKMNWTKLNKCMTEYQEKFSCLWNDIPKLNRSRTTELETDDEKDNDVEDDGFFVRHGYLKSPDKERNDNGQLESL